MACYCNILISTTNDAVARWRCSVPVAVKMITHYSSNSSAAVARTRSPKRGGTRRSCVPSDFDLSNSSTWYSSSYLANNGSLRPYQVTLMYVRCTTTVELQRHHYNLVHTFRAKARTKRSERAIPWNDVRTSPQN